MRPTLYLTNASSTKRHGPGRLICAMANPARHHRGDGRCLACAPFADDLAAVRSALADPDDAGQHRAALARYRAHFEGWCNNRAALGRYAPGDLSFVTWAPTANVRSSSEIVTDGDTLFCACARPGSPKRRTPCHLEAVVPYLVRAGWDIILDGELVTMGPDGPIWATTYRWAFRKADGTLWMSKAEKGEPYRSESFGWPETQ